MSAHRAIEIISICTDLLFLDADPDVAIDRELPGEDPLIAEEQATAHIRKAIFLETDGKAVTIGKGFLGNGLDRFILVACLVHLDEIGVFGKPAGVDEKMEDHILWRSCLPP